MPWIVNHSFTDIIKGLHPLDPGRTILIRIADPGVKMDNLDVFHLDSFVQVHCFNFFDEESGYGILSEDDAVRIVGILTEAFKKNLNVVVHCAMGICRSGAVTEAGVIMGFDDGESHRIPNLHVKKLLLKYAGFSNSWDGDAEKQRAQELTAKHYLCSTGGSLLTEED